MPRYYIAGPMTGYVKHNYPSFARVAEVLRMCGIDAVNPAENHDGRRDLPRHEYLRTDIPQLLTCDAIVLLSGWMRSPGATLEAAIAYNCGLDIYEWDHDDERLLSVGDIAFVLPAAIVPDTKPTEPGPEGAKVSPEKVEDFLEGVTLVGPDFDRQRDLAEFIHKGPIDSDECLACGRTIVFEGGYDTDPCVRKDDEEWDEDWEEECFEGCGCDEEEDGDPARLETILTEAQALVYGDRQAAYSHPMGDFTAMGRISGAIIERWLNSEGYTLLNSEGDPIDFPDIPPRIATMMMQAVKLSREAANPKRDNRVDGAGYWLCTDRAITGE